MKTIRAFICLTMVVAVLFASSLNTSAIGFVAEEAYEAVFIVYSGNSMGSGFAIGKNCIITNAHVVEDAKNILIQSYYGEEYEAYVVGMDVNRDIAVLGVKNQEFPFLKMASMSEVSIGDDIYAIGAPKSMSYTLTKGVISAKDRELGDYSYIQIDAPVNHGNSGGPLLNDAGKVLGVNTLKISDSEGIGLAIPMETIVAFLEELGVKTEEDGSVSKTVLPSPKEIESGNPESEAYEPGTRTVVKRENGVLTTVLIIVTVVSIATNIGLCILLFYQRKKNLDLKYDPRERTDFNIDILE